MTPPFVFVLGRTPDLAYAELSYLYPSIHFDRIHERAVLTHTAIDPDQCIQNLGGTVAIGELLETDVEISPSRIAKLIERYKKRSVVFSVSTLDHVPISESFFRDVKHELKQMGISSRYIFNPKPEPLSAVVSKGQNVLDYVCIPLHARYNVCRVIATQPVNAWIQRDIKRPNVDSKRGMLPLKVARMLVNIVSSEKSKSSHPVLLDPFCGMGSILAEALLCGWHVIGADISHDVVNKAEDNLLWLQKQYPSITSSFITYTVDATHISEKLDEHSVDCIVTEPFLGSPSFAIQSDVDDQKVRDMIKGLEKLYLGCLKDWKDVLRQGGLVLIAFPQVSLKGRELSVKRVIDRRESLGYSVIDGPWMYARPQAFIKRAFYLLRST